MNMILYDVLYRWLLGTKELTTKGKRIRIRSYLVVQIVFVCLVCFVWNKNSRRNRITTRSRGEESQGDSSIDFHPEIRIIRILTGHFDG